MSGQEQSGPGLVGPLAEVNQARISKIYRSCFQPGYWKGEPPEGYAFLEVGDSARTKFLKKSSDVVEDLARERFGWKVVGYWAPKEAVGAALAWESRATEAEREHRRIARQERHERQFAAAIREQFPNIPESVERKVIEHACEVGSGRVGRTKRVPLNERARLAVFAHIRHELTDYEPLIGEFRRDGFDAIDAREFARQEVEADVCCIAEKWGFTPDT